jgi:UDP-N-acetylglucosamine diphosphorylase/glucosamine-1-phosphate N-acetyltransferase
MSLVVIMAGGLGKRMNSDLPKVLHKIAGKPMLVHVITQALLINPLKIMVIVGKYREKIIETIKEYMDNKDIIYIDQPTPLGTGHALQCCREELLKYPNTNTIILSGDVPLLKSNTINEMLLSFNKAKIMTTELENPSGYGRIIEENDEFAKIMEDKDCNEREKNVKKVNCGIYAFHTEILCKYLPFLSNNNSQKEYYLTDIVQIIKDNEQLNIDTYNIPLERQIEIIGVNTADQLAELERRMV